MCVKGERHIDALQYYLNIHYTSLKDNEINLNQNMISLRRTSYIVIIKIMCLNELDIVQLNSF